MNGKSASKAWLIFSILSLTFFGCATKKTVMDNIRASEERQDQKIAELRQEMATISDKAETDSNRALQLAQEANQTSSILKTEFASRNNLVPKMEKTIYFGFDIHSLDNDARAVLNQIATMLNQDDNSVVLIEGHTDSMGSESYNYALSFRRVSSVIGFLVNERNVPLNQIHPAGLGEAYPATDNYSEDGRSRNRRVIIRVLSPQ
jgi:outer membrane protein OmpA-like peptidoglycan-associated protein